MPIDVLKAVIIEDERHARQALIDILAMVCPNVELLGFAENVDQGYQLISKFSPDLVFLDIQLGNDQSFKLLEKFTVIDFKIIFVTAFNDFAEEAFRFSAIDYLLKPINPDRLKHAVDKVQQHNNQEQTQVMLATLQENLKSSGKHQKKLVLATQEMLHVVDVNQIIACKSSANYTVFCLKDGQELIISKTLREYEEQLTSYGFMRVHRSWLVNLDAVKGYDKREGGFLIMQNDTKVPVSNQKKNALLQLLN